MAGAAAGVHLGEPAAPPVRDCIRSPGAPPVDRGVAGHRRGVDGTAASAIGQRYDRVIVGVGRSHLQEVRPALMGPSARERDAGGRRLPGRQDDHARGRVVGEVGRASVRLRGHHMMAATSDGVYETGGSPPRPGCPYSVQGTLPVLVSSRMVPSWRGEAGTSRGRPTWCRSRAGLGGGDAGSRDSPGGWPG